MAQEAVSEDSASERALLDWQGAFFGFLVKRLGNLADADDVLRAFCIKVPACRDLGFLGVHRDENRNAAGEPVISADQGHVQVRVIAIDEDVIIAKAVFRMLAGTENQPARPARGASP